MDAFNQKDRLLEEKLFHVALYVLVVMSLFSIVGNIVFGFPFHVNYKWMAMIVVSIFTRYMLYKGIHVLLSKTLFFVFLIYAIFPLSWFDSGGSANNAIAYLFLLTICTTFFFQGKRRFVFVMSLIGIFSALLIIEYVRPEWIATHSAESQFFDRLLQIPLTVFAAYLFMRLFANAHQEERTRLDTLSQIDPLTNMYNRRAFDQAFYHYLDTRDEDAYLIFFDIDQFKAINDKLGHYGGDQVLRYLSEHLHSIFKAEDVIGRWGGDEFVVLFKGNEQALESILKDLHAFTYSLSTGVTKIQPTDQTLDAVMKRVDQASYDVKNTGKGFYKIV